MSDLLNQASLVYIPSGYKEDTAYTVIPTDGSGDLTFTRASDGTRVNSQGLVEQVPWNLLQQSQSFSTSGSVWNYTTGSGVITGQTGYDGTTNAVLFTDSGANPVYGAYQSFTKLGSVTLSIYAKAGSTNIFYIDIFQTPLANVKVNLSTGAITSGSGVVQNVGNGWYRISVTAVMTDSYYVRFGCPSTGNVYIQNIQANIGSTAKPYFPTTDRQNVPRLDYSNGCPSLLLEPQRTNLVTYSEQFDNGAWTKEKTTITANNTTSPDGTANADKLTEDSSNGIHVVYTTSAISTTAAQAYTASVFYKKGTRRYFSIKLQNGSSSYTQVFDADGVTTGSSSSNGLTGVSTSIISMGNGWVKASVTGTSSTTGAYFIIGLSDSASPTFDPSNFNPTYTGTGTDYGYIWGAQLEAGSYPTSYIPTTSASVTRVADEASKTGISSLIGGTSGTVFFDIKTNPTLSSALYKQFFYYTDSSASQGYMYLNSSNAVVTNVSYGNLTSSITLSPNTRYKIALTYANNDFALYVNGASVATASSGTPLNFENLLSLGSYNGTSEWNEFVFNQYAHFPTRLTNAELAALTTL